MSRPNVYACDAVGCRAESKGGKRPGWIQIDVSRKGSTYVYDLCPVHSETVLKLIGDKEIDPE